MSMKTILRTFTVVTIGLILGYPILGVARNWTHSDSKLEGLTRWLNPTFCLYIAAVLVAGWTVAAFLSRSRSTQIILGLAAVLYLWLYHISAIYSHRCEINMRRVALRAIDAHLNKEDISEVRRAIRIHDEEFATSGDGLSAARDLLHELNRATE